MYNWNRKQDLQFLDQTLDKHPTQKVQTAGRLEAIYKTTHIAREYQHKITIS